jgi:Ca2+/H+ antiporter, TMEM165/GDT1 family
VELGNVAATYATIFPVELPDKTFIATLVLATRYRGLLVWIGVGLAFAVQCAVAVTAGGLLSALPDAVVSGGAAVLFLAGAVLLWRGAGAADEEEAAAEQEFAEKATAQVHGFRAVATSFGVLFLAEWGDLSQLLTMGLAAQRDDPVGVFLGSWTALLTVSGLAVLLGRSLLRHISLAMIRRIGAVVCLLLAALATYDVVRELT